MSDNDERETGLGKTAGLPGTNADDRAAQLSDNEMADTVSTADVAPPARADQRGDDTGNEEGGDRP